MDDSLYLSVQELERSDLSARGWAVVGCSLLFAKNSFELHKRKTTFTAFVKDLARSNRIQPSILWRWMRAFELYEHFRSRYRDLDLPDHSIVQDKTSPEVIEILGKLARVAPESELRKWLGQVACGDARRKHLRDAWLIYKDGNSAKSPRGRRRVGHALSVEPSRIADAKLLEAQVFERFMEFGHKWIGLSSEPAVYRGFVHQRLPTGKIIDLVALVKEAGDSEYFFHAVEIGIEMSEKKVDYLAAIQDYIDYVWIASASEIVIQRFEAISPAHVGLICIEEFPRIVRRASRTALLGKLSKQLAAHILAVRTS